MRILRCCTQLVRNGRARDVYPSLLRKLKGQISWFSAKDGAVRDQDQQAAEQEYSWLSQGRYRVKETNVEIVCGKLSAIVEDVRTAIPGRWLRDHCRCSGCRNADTGQREINVFKHEDAVEVVAVQRSREGQGFDVTFKDGHRSHFPRHFLEQREAYDTGHQRVGMIAPTTWDSGISSSPPIVQYLDLSYLSGPGRLLQKMRMYGFCFVDSVEPTPEATQALLERIGPIRNTHYGGFYDFTSDLSSKDTAYTADALEPHTDNIYFTEPAGLQALHMLSHTDGSGGESSLVDGFHIAEQVRKLDPKAYDLLSRTGIYAHASGNDGISIQPSQAFPIFSHHPELGHLTQVRWNNADRAGVATPYEKLDEWYDAAAKLDRLLGEPENQYWFQLKPGRLLIFDNWRVLHGRSTFTGKRRMCGGYINRDDYISRYRVTNLSEGELEASTVTG